MVRPAGVEPATVGFGGQRLHSVSERKVGGHGEN